MNDQCNPNESAIFSIQDGEVMGGTVCAIMTSDGKPQSFKQKTTILNGVSTISFIDEDGIEVSAIDGKIVPCSSIVYVGNQTAGGGGSSTDYTALITAIKNSVQSIDGDTDALAGILLAVDTLESIGTTGNATTSQILTAVSSILTQAQETNANTDQLEALLTSISTTLQTESDQTQAGLVDIKEAIDAIPLDAEYLQLVDYVEGGQVIGTAGVTMLTLNDLVPVSISGSAPVWTSPNFGATDASTSWKLVSQLQTVDGQKYNVQSLLGIPQSTIKLIVGTQELVLTSGYDDNIEFIGDGTIVEIGYLFLPNTSASNTNGLTVTTLASVAPETCTDFLRKIVGTTVTDLKVVGSSLVPYVVLGVVRTSCPIVTTKTAVFEHGFSAPNTDSSKVFEGYKSLSVRVLSGSIVINDGTNSVTYPLAGDDGNVAGVNYSFHEGFTINNTISVFKQSAASSFIWTGVK